MILIIYLKIEISVATKTLLKKSQSKKLTIFCIADFYSKIISSFDVLTSFPINWFQTFYGAVVFGDDAIIIQMVIRN